MSGPKHTPGPWVTSGVRGGTIRNAANGKPLAFTTKPDFREAEREPGEAWLDFWLRTEPQRKALEAEEDANARLIAAAPDLLEALVMVRDTDEDCERDGLPTIPYPARKRIDAAIAKATGEQP